jgi:hypothetical protein
MFGNLDICLTVRNRALWTSEAAAACYEEISSKLLHPDLDPAASASVVAPALAAALRADSIRTGSDPGTRCTPALGFSPATRFPTTC